MKPIAKISNPAGVVTRNAIAIAIFLLGLTQMAGYMLNISWLQGLGAISTVAPFPKVFSDVDGIETFASRFTLVYHDDQGEKHHMELTPEIYALFHGPYNRRNVYGAALSYGPTPRFPKRLFNAVFHYGMVDPGPLKHDLGLPDDASGVSLVIQTKTKGRHDQWILPPNE